MIEIVKKGFITLPVSTKRHLLERFGVPTGGPADPFLCIIANRLVGNPDDACALEAILMLPGIRFCDDRTIAVAGAVEGMILHRGDEQLELPVNRTVCVKAGDELVSKPLTAGMRAYIAVSGGVRADKLRSDPVSDGQKLDLNKNIQPVRRSITELPIPMPGNEAELRVISGVQQEQFSKEGEAAFYGGEYLYTPDSSRMGIRLSGPAVAFREGFDGNILSEGMLPGDIQITSSGQPILMLSDCPATGGYAKIAHVITTDLPIAAQLHPGAILRFRQVDVAQAHVAMRRLLIKLDACLIKE
ncbi:MAG: biotin-dependent carboxyltransferase family protein [Clostridia bacterium]|nr:biotin-dependent carboxyltransferase family protein [Clostridia bacterium]